MFGAQDIVIVAMLVLVLSSSCSSTSSSRGRGSSSSSISSTLLICMYFRAELYPLYDILMSCSEVIFLLLRTICFCFVALCIGDSHETEPCFTEPCPEELPMILPQTLPQVLPQVLPQQPQELPELSQAAAELHPVGMEGPRPVGLDEGYGVIGQQHHAGEGMCYTLIPFIACGMRVYSCVYCIMNMVLCCYAFSIFPCATADYGLTCAAAPCLNGGSCYDVLEEPVLHRYIRFRCKCVLPYTGVMCDSECDHHYG